MSCSSVVDAYASSAAKVQSQVSGACARSGDLPFTGLNLFVVACIAIMLLGVGAIILAKTREGR